MKNQPFTQAYLFSILYYNSYSGYWTYKGIRNGTNNVYAGYKRKKGYWCIVINGKSYYAHVLAYFYVTGKWPKNDIDHKDNNRSNNVFYNLREATRSQNMANGVKKKNNKTGYIGVSFFKRTKKYRPRITKDGKEYCLGYYNCPTKAALVRDRKAKELFGPFASLNFPFIR